MKATQKDFASLAMRAARSARVVFLCGPDEAGARDAADSFIGQLADPGERIELAGADLRRDPARLGDEARSTSLFGGARHILVRASGDEAHDAVAILIDSAVATAPVVILASSATDKSRTAKLLADRPDALVAMFYPPDRKAVAARVRELGGAAGLRLNDALAERIAAACLLDIGVIRSELTKLALYLDASPERPRDVSPEALAAIGARSEEDGLAPLVDAVLGGHANMLSNELRRMRELALNPVSVLLACERRAVVLADLVGKLGQRRDSRSIAALIEAEKAARRVFWKDAPVLTRQLACWPGARAERLVARLMALHRDLLTDSAGAETRLAQALVEITRFAGSLPGRGA